LERNIKTDGPAGIQNFGRPVSFFVEVDARKHAMSITIVELIMRLGTSVLLGSAIGYEREMRERPAGLRTHLLVSLASATFMLVSSQFPFPQNYQVTVADGFLRADVGRIASNVVVGIGFLGGGAILHSGLRIEGLTTAASLWMVAAVGLASGAGLYLLAFSSALFALLALVWLRFVENRFKRVLKLRVRIDTVGEFLSRAQVETALTSIGAIVKDVDYARDRAVNRSRIHVDIRLPRHDVEEAMVKILEELPSVQGVRVRRPGG
jgi:putative Mg2+ transporter-C (MgtC) family protein